MGACSSYIGTTNVLTIASDRSLQKAPTDQTEARKMRQENSMPSVLLRTCYNSLTAAVSENVRSSELRARDRCEAEVAANPSGRSPVLMDGGDNAETGRAAIMLPRIRLKLG